MTRSRVIAIALFASLALNLFLGGVMVGRWLAPQPPAAAFEAGGFGGLIANMRAAAAMLPAEQQAALREAMGHHRTEIRQELIALRDARQAALATLAGEPFDRGATEAAFVELQMRSQAVQTAIHEAMLDAAERLPVEARRHLVESGRHWPGDRGMMGRGGSPSHRPPP